MLGSRIEVVANTSNKQRTGWDVNWKGRGGGREEQTKKKANGKSKPEGKKDDKHHLHDQREM